jgi:hypothetical protein
MYMFPAFILGPIAIFYAALAVAGVTTTEARDAKWFYPIVDEPPFWHHLVELYSGMLDGKVAWDVLPRCSLTWLSMVLITCLDSLLMLTTTETVVAIDVDYDYEMRIGSRATLLNALLGGQPVCTSQLLELGILALLHSRNLLTSQSDSLCPQTRRPSSRRLTLPSPTACKSRGLPTSAARSAARSSSRRFS